MLFPGMATPTRGGPPGGYRIQRAIDSGGFGITYEAVKREGGDPESDVTANLWLPPHRAIVIKEFYPEFALRRGRTVTVEGEDESHEETFNHALRRFQREAERLCYLTCLRALRAGRRALDSSSGSLGDKIDREVATGSSDPSRAMQLVGRLRGDARLEAQQALSVSTLPIVYDFFAADNNAYYVMEFLGGGTLKSRLAEDRRHGTTRIEVEGVSYTLRQPWSPDRLRRFAVASLDALEELHTGIPSQQLIHCDLKPGNIMFRSPESESPVLIDFGLARNVNDGRSRSLVAGTLGFAPLEIDPNLRSHHQSTEQFGGANVGPWTDIYSMAAIFRMLATGIEGTRLPPVFERARADGGVDPIDKLPPFPDGFPEQLERAIRLGMGLHRKDRPQSVEEWRADLGFVSRRTPAIETTPVPNSGGLGGWALDKHPPQQSQPGMQTQMPPAEPLPVTLFKPGEPIDETLIDRSAGSAPRAWNSPPPPLPPRDNWQASQPAPSQPYYPPAPPPPPQPRYEARSEPARPQDDRWSGGTDAPTQRGFDRPPPPGRPPSPPYDRPRSLDLGAVINRTVKLFGSNAGPILLFAVLLGGLPNAIFSMVSTAQQGSTGGAQALFVIAMLFIWPIVLVASILQQTAIIRIVTASESGQRLSIGEALSGSFSILLPMIGLVLLLSIAVGVGIILLVVPGLILACMWCVATPVLVIERVRVTEAFKRSQELTAGSRWPIFALMLIYGVALFIIILILGVFMTVSGAEATGVIGFFVNLIITTLVGAIFCTGAAALYLALREAKGEAHAGEYGDVFS